MTLIKRINQPGGAGKTKVILITQIAHSWREWGVLLQRWAPGQRFLHLERSEHKQLSHINWILSSNYLVKPESKATLKALSTSVAFVRFSPEWIIWCVLRFEPWVKAFLCRTCKVSPPCESSCNMQGIISDWRLHDNHYIWKVSLQYGLSD